MSFSIATLAFFVSVLVALLALYFKRSIPMFLSLIILIWQPIYIIEQTTPLIQYHISLSICIPLVFIFIGLQDEKGIYNKSGLAKFVLSLFVLLVSYQLSQSVLILTALLQPILTFKIPFFKQVNDASLILFFATLFLFIVKLIVKKDLKDLTLIIAFILSMIPFVFSFPPHETPWFLALSAGSMGVMLVREAYKMAFIDALTQIPSRRALEEYAAGLTPPFSICMVDIDYFKKFNDTYGHDIGDEVLKYVAKELKNVKGGGKAFRYGGEEFTIIFANKFNHQARKYLEDVRISIHKKKFIIRDKNRSQSGEYNRNKTSFKNNEEAKLSVSMGVCDTGDASHVYDMLILADKALYKAKESGRNCLKTYQK